MDEDAYQAYRSVTLSPTLRQIWAEAYDDLFWSDVDPPWTQATRDDAFFMTARLRLGQASRIIDLGCGAGCFMRFLAREFGQHSVGLDANPMAIRVAQERCGRLVDKLSFQQGDLGDTGFRAGMFDGAVSLDVLLFVPDKDKALREIARILKPGASFVGTTFELKSASASLGTPAFEDYPGAFQAAGFSVETYEEARDWRKLAEAVTTGVLARQAELSREIRAEAWQRISDWARHRPLELAESRRTRFCVRRI